MTPGAYLQPPEQERRKCLFLFIERLYLGIIKDNAFLLYLEPRDIIKKKWGWELAPRDGHRLGTWGPPVSIPGTDHLVSKAPKRGGL